MAEDKSHHKHFFKQLFKKHTKGQTQGSDEKGNPLEHIILDYYESFAQLHPDVILIFSLDGKVISPRNRLNAYLGYKENEHLALKNLMTQENFSNIQHAFEQASEGETATTNIHLYGKDENKIYCSATFMPIKQQGEEVEHIFLRLRDIRKEELLEKSNQMKSEEIIEMNDNYKHIFNNLHVGIWMAESVTKSFTFASQGMEDITQIPLQQIYEEHDYWEKLIIPEHQEMIFEQYDKLQGGESIECTYCIIDGNGMKKWIYEQSIPRLNEEGRVIQLFGMVTDITDEKQMGEELKFLARHDALTGLPNYHYLDEKLETYIESDETETIALLYLEIDNFHWILDYLGHQIGDMVLQQISERLRRITPSHGFLAKVDRESFVFLIQNYTSKSAITHFSEQIMELVSEEIFVEGYEFYVTASIGIGFYPDTAKNKLMIMGNAHTALYYAKHLGKNNSQVYSLDRDISAHKKYVLERDLRKAIHQEEFELFYQPQVDPITGQIRSLEALIRWRHPHWGLVSPNEFISIAEEKHLIHEMEDWVLRTVCKQIRAWIDEGLPTYAVSLNLSPLRFLKPGVVENAKHALQKYDISPSLIELEITENKLLEDKKNVEKTLATMKNLGFGIALDDFGKGYSSFHYLQKYDVDTIKIDKMFIQQLGSTDKKNESIVQSIIQLAKALHVQVVAEGVEELAQLEFLKEHGCDLIQGYLFSKPAPPAELRDLLTEEYITPMKQEHEEGFKEECREEKWFVFPHYLHATMDIAEVQDNHLDLGAANILVTNISVEGLSFLTSIRIPITTNLQLDFHCTLLGENFDIRGELVYVEEEKKDNFFYGVHFQLDEEHEQRLRRRITEMETMKEDNKPLPHTPMIEEDPFVFLQENRL